VGGYIFTTNDVAGHGGGAPTLRRSAPGQAMSSFRAVTTGAFHANPEPLIPGVPEPGAWALMLIGFDSAGAMLRARRRVGGRV